MSSPYHQQANGKAEACVKVAKSLLKKADKRYSNFWLSLLNHRNIANKIESSPAQRLYSRRLRCQLPVKESKLKAYIIPEVPEKIIENKQSAKFYYDKTTRKLKELEIGQAVVVRLNPEIKKWSQGVVTQQVKDRSYIINIDGNLFRRNREHIRPFSVIEEPTHSLCHTDAPITPRENPPEPSEQSTTSEESVNPLVQSMNPLVQEKTSVSNSATNPPERQDSQNRRNPSRIKKLPARLQDYEIYHISC